ncbi:MAG: 16S rRNA (cytosine(1402)-N(4))-methyltransferase RsmH [Ignavibacteriaceae bacterium]|nr:16S rRNA (cytosine(1402)-N(4))-methyltransferase RsmH [Ignavibacteriaceae bacterium]
MDNHHVPVLFNESLSHLITNPSGVYFDGTLGFGGHSSGILQRLNENGLLIAADVDKDAFDFSKKKFETDKRVKLYNLNFSQIDIISKIESVDKFTGIFADLGVSSFQLDNPESGFTYRSDAKLDLRMDKTRVVNAADILNSFTEENIANIIYQFGEEKNSRQIAKKICILREKKSISTTGELVEIIKEITPQKFWNKTLSRVFQAFRIYVNDELETLKNFIDKAVDLLDENGRLVILTYHSLEDRIVKEKFKYETLSCICPNDFPICMCDKKQRLKIITKKPVLPSDEEVALNFRARSAKLRAAEKI